MTQQLVWLDARAVEHALIDAGLNKRQLAAQMAWHPNSLAGVLTQARRGEPVRRATVILLAAALGVGSARLILAGDGVDA